VHPIPRSTKAFLTALTMTDDPTFSRVKETFEQWALYEAVVEHDYMLHAELIEALGRWAADFGRPLKILDLGCGDAYLATQAFQAADVASYEGLDLSEEAARRARERLQIWPGRSEIKNGNFSELIAHVPDGSKNLVLASYSLHHFHGPQKESILSECRGVLESGGALIWIDSVMRDGETRDQYLARQTDWFRREWTGLTTEQCEQVVAHVWEADFPESAAWMNRATAQAGFAPGEPLLQSEFFAAWEFCRT
jgi:ubiquinone/menaquinone biosynthesis C-methylase UbiE